jgi:hypothetical protein
VIAQADETGVSNFGRLAGMTVFTIDRASGELKPIGHYLMGTQPN